jgi:hypothetical protein
MQELVSIPTRVTVSRTPLLRLSALALPRAAPSPQPSPSPSPTSKAMHADVRARSNFQQPFPRPQSALEGEVAAAARTSSRARLGSADSVGSIGPRVDLGTNPSRSAGAPAVAGASMIFGAFQLVRAEPLHSSPPLQASGGPATAGSLGSAGRRTSAVGPWGSSSAGSPASIFSLGGLPFPSHSSQSLPPSHVLHMHTLASSQPSGLHDRTVVSLVSASPSREAGPLYLQHALGGGLRASRPSPPPSALTVPAVDGVPSSGTPGPERLRSSGHSAILHRTDAALLEHGSNVYTPPVDGENARTALPSADVASALPSVARIAVEGQTVQVGEANECAEPSSARATVPAAHRGAELPRSTDARGAQHVVCRLPISAPSSAGVNGAIMHPRDVAEVPGGIAAHEAAGCALPPFLAADCAGVTTPVGLRLMEAPSLSLPELTLTTGHARESTTHSNGGGSVARETSTFTRQSTPSDDFACICRQSCGVSAFRGAIADGNASTERGALLCRSRIHATVSLRLQGEEIERMIPSSSCEASDHGSPCLLRSEGPFIGETAPSRPALLVGNGGCGTEAQLLPDHPIQSLASVVPAAPGPAGLVASPTLCARLAQWVAADSIVDARLADAMVPPRHSIPAPTCVPEYASIVIPRIAPVRSSPPLFTPRRPPTRSSSISSGNDGEPDSAICGGQQNSSPADLSSLVGAPMVQPRLSRHESVRRARMRPHNAARDALTTRGFSIVVAKAASDEVLGASSAGSDVPSRLSSEAALHRDGGDDSCQTTTTVPLGSNRTQRHALLTSSPEPRWLDGPSVLQGASLLSTASSSSPPPPSASIHHSAVVPEWHRPSPPPSPQNRSTQTEEWRLQRHVLHQDTAPPSPAWASGALQGAGEQTAADGNRATGSFHPHRPEKPAGAQTSLSRALGHVAGVSPSATLSSHAAPASFSATAAASDDLSLSTSAAQWTMGSVAAAASRAPTERTDEARHSLPSPSNLVLALVNATEPRGHPDRPEGVHRFFPRLPSSASRPEPAPGASHLEPATRLMSVAPSPLLLDTNLRRRYARQRREESAAAAAASATMLAASTARSRIRSGEDVAASKVLQAAEGAWAQRPIGSGGKEGTTPGTPGPAMVSSVHADMHRAAAVVAASGAPTSWCCPGVRTWNMRPIACDLRSHGEAVPALITCRRAVHGGRFLKVQLRGKSASCEIALMCRAAGTDGRSPLVVLRTLRYTHGSGSVLIRESALHTASGDGVADRILPLAALPSRWARMYVHLAAGVSSIRARLPRVAALRYDTVDDDVHGIVRISSLALLMDDGNPGLHSYSFTLRLQRIKAGVPHVDVWKMQYWPRRSHLLCVVAPWGESVSAYLALPRSSPALLSTLATLAAVASEPMPARSIASLPLPAASVVALGLRYHAICFATEASLLPQLFASRGDPPSAVLPVVLQPRERFLDKETFRILMRAHERRWTAEPSLLPSAALAAGNSAPRSPPDAGTVSMSGDSDFDLRGANGAEACGGKPGEASVVSRVVAAAFLGEDAAAWAALEKCSEGASDVASADTARLLLREPLRWLCLLFTDSWRLLLRDDAAVAATIRPRQLAVSLHPLRCASDTARLPPEVSRRLATGRSFLRAVLDLE